MAGVFPDDVFPGEVFPDPVFPGTGTEEGGGPEPVPTAATRHGGVRPFERRYRNRQLSSLEAEFRAMERM